MTHKTDEEIAPSFRYTKNGWARISMSDWIKVKQTLASRPTCEEAVKAERERIEQAINNIKLYRNSEKVDNQADLINNWILPAIKKKFKEVITPLPDNNERE